MGQLDNRPDGVDTYLADLYDFYSYRQAEQALSRLQVPVLLHADNPHERLYVAAMDDTGNSLYDDAPENRSIVAKMHLQIDALRDQGIDNIRSGYVEGTFTQDNPIARYADGVSGFTFERRVETAYHQFCEQASKWLAEDPDAQIRIVGIGFSRSAEQVAALHRMIDERGIMNPEDAKVTRDKDGLITQVEYTKPPLVPPGQTIQVALLYDPVSTGVQEHDRRLPPSVVSALQITAEDERRDQFTSTNLLQPGFSEGNRFLNVTVAGAHSNIGDTYSLNGIGIRSGNLGVDFVNALSDRALLSKRAVPDDPALSVVHRSDQHAWFYTTLGYRDGVRDRHNDLAPDVLCQRGPVRDCAIKEPIDPELDRQLERRGVPIGPLPATPGHRQDNAQIEVEMPQRHSAAYAPGMNSRFFPRTAEDDYVERFLAASEHGDYAGRQTLTQRYEQLPQAQALQQEAREALAAERQRALEEEQRRQAQEQQWLMQQQAQHERSRGHARSM